MIIWLTGQPGAGKTVLAKKLCDSIDYDYHIDGDDLRELTDNKNYGIEGRVSNVSTAQKIALYLHNQGKNVVVSLVSPYLDQREEFKAKVKDKVKEVYIHTSESRERDHFHVKGYQKPVENFIDIDTTVDTPQESLNKLLDALF